MFSTHTLCVEHSYNSLSLTKSYEHTVLCVFPISNIYCVLVNRSNRKRARAKQERTATSAMVHQRRNGNLRFCLFVYNLVQQKHKVVVVVFI